MAGHSAWANIKHRKAAQDKRRSKLFTKLVKEIYISVKEGGADPEGNARLKMAIRNARKASVPRDTIDKAIKKGSGTGGDEYEEFTLEGYGPNGVAIFVEVMTDNSTRAIQNVRAAFNKYGGALGKNGSVGYLFDRRGVFVFPAEGVDEEAITAELLDAGLYDLQREEDSFVATCLFEDYGLLAAKFDGLGIDTENTLERIPQNYVELDPERARPVMKMLEILEDDDDVQNVFHNLELTEEIEAAMG
ncbi:MAG: YebC/PmpR family DNA-binding transcriptional regulator [Bacteroidia bacterium]|nr:YebC/PmpR family DNA-binding transcriptional regulator [Bacteroidia bacterium]